MRDEKKITAGILVTGTEVLNGQIADRNGPWLSEQLRDLGVELLQITVVGDRPDDLLKALEQLTELGVNLIVTTGGLGPTADDLTMQVVAEFASYELELNAEMERRINELLERLSSRYPNADREAMAVGTRKQATVPVGAELLNPAGTAPGAVLAGSEGCPAIVVLPGPPTELQPLWLKAQQTATFTALTADLPTYRLGVLRMYAFPESELAATLRVIEDELDLSTLEITTCLRRGEIEIATRYRDTDLSIYEDFVAAIERHYAGRIFSRDGRTIDELVAELLKGHSVATAESCTGGLLAGCLTSIPRVSEYFRGGLVVYSNESKSELAGVEPALIERFGAVSPEVAALLADGASSRFGAELGVGITGIAGPDGATDTKPVGYVCISVANRNGTRLTRELNFPGDRETVRDRSVTTALHLLRRLLLGESDG